MNNLTLLASSDRITHHACATLLTVSSTFHVFFAHHDTWFSIVVESVRFPHKGRGLWQEA